MREYKSEENPLACHLLGQVLTERGKKDQDEEALKAGDRLLRIASDAEARVKAKEQG